MSSPIDEIREILRACADLRPRIPPERVTPETRLREDLGFDSLGLMSLLYELQDRHPEVSIDESAIARWRTVGCCIRELGAAA